MNDICPGRRVFDRKSAGDGVKGEVVEKRSFGKVEYSGFVGEVCVLDPGGTSGFAMCDDGVAELFEVSSGALYGYVKQADWLAAQIMSHGNKLVLEDFMLTGPGRGGWSSDRAGLAPHAIIHALLAVLYERQWDGQIWLQQPGQKDVINNGRLKALGLWVVGSEHCRDVMRHYEVWRRDGKKANLLVDSV